MNQRVLRAVDVELTAAAAERWVVPVEGFLWRARRCAEAMLYALLVEAKVDVTQLAEQGKGLDNLAKHAKLQGVIPRAMRDHLDSAQKYGNSATHFQPEGPASDANATIVANALSELARWFYTRDDRALPEALHGPLAALIDVRHRVRPPAELALEQERRRAHELTQQLRAAATPSVVRPPPPFTARLAAIGVGLVALGGVVGFGVGRGSDPPLNPPVVMSTTNTSVVPPGPQEPPPPPVDAMTPVPAPVALEPSPIRAPLACLPSMARVEDSRDREAFCVDLAPVTGTEYRQCVTAGLCPRPLRGDGCNWQLGRDDLAVNCVPLASARAYCRFKHGPGGDLPGHEDWRMVGVNRVGEAVLRGTLEWSADSLQGGVQRVRGHRQGADFAWSTRAESRGYPNVSFRCVLRAGPP